MFIERFGVVPCQALFITSDFFAFLLILSFPLFRVAARSNGRTPARYWRDAAAA
jgi:hypothetical protein